MLNPIRLLGGSLKQFALGLGPATAMAFVCLAIQLGVPMAVIYAGDAIFPPERPPDLFESLSRMRANDWRYDAGQLIEYTVPVSILFFFHALVALILTAWLLRRRAGFVPGAVLRRAVRGAGVLTGAAAVGFAAAFFFGNLLPATRDIPFDFRAAAMLALWFGGTALLLPARLMGHEPAAAPGFLRTTLVATIALVPWFYASEVLGAPIRHCRECGGFFEGGLVFIPLLGAYLLGLTVSSAAVSATACMLTESPPAPAA